MLLEESLSLFQPLKEDTYKKNRNCDFYVAIDLQQVKTKGLLHLRHSRDKTLS